MTQPVPPVWSRTASIHPLALGTALVVMAVLTFRAVTSWMAGDPDGLSWLPTTLAAALFVLIATTMAFTVRVDAHGLTVRSLFGLPRFRVALADVDAVDSVDVRPLRHFGGWGLRRRDGVFGVIMRRGAAIRVRRRNGTFFVVTVRDAQTGAQMLGTRVRAHRAGL